jgi:hypothetical protein
MKKVPAASGVIQDSASSAVAIGSPQTARRRVEAAFARIREAIERRA